MLAQQSIFCLGIHQPWIWLEPLTLTPPCLLPYLDARKLKVNGRLPVFSAEDKDVFLTQCWLRPKKISQVWWCTMKRTWTSWSNSWNRRSAILVKWTRITRHYWIQSYWFSTLVPNITLTVVMFWLYTYSISGTLLILRISYCFQSIYSYYLSLILVCNKSLLKNTQCFILYSFIY